MDIKIQKQTGNLLDLKVTITHDPAQKMMQQSSCDYFFGAVKFQLQVDSCNSPYGQQAFFAVYARYHKALQNDNLVYKCNIEVKKMQRNQHGYETGLKKETETNFTDSQKWNLIFKEHNTWLWTFYVTVQFALGISVTPLIASLYEDTELTDFNLKGVDGSSVSVHSNILAGVSPVLKKMLTGNWKETSNRSVAIADTTKETLEHFKQYVYLGKLPETGLDKLLLLGSCYLVPDLVQKCIVQILFTITSDNIFDFIEFAIKNKFNHLLVSILKVVESEAISLDNLSYGDWSKVLQSLLQFLLQFYNNVTPPSLFH